MSSDGAETLYRLDPTGETLAEWKDVVFATAEYMADFMQLDTLRGKYVLAPPICPVSENTPIFEKITVHLENGDLVIAGGSETRIYTTGLKIDGKPHAKAWISWEDVCNGAVVEYTTSTRPSGNWGREQLPPSFGN